MRRIINLVLVVTLILSAVPVGVSAQNDVEYTPERLPAAWRTA